MFTEFEVPSLVAEATRISGDVIFKSVAQVFGLVEGNIQQQSVELLQIGRGGWVVGEIHSVGEVRIEGKVEGGIHSSSKITLTSTALVRGKLRAPKIEILAGAQIEGQLDMLGQSISQTLPAAA